MGDSSAVGKRVVYEEHFGTVKYAGKVGETKGQWLGVEWDEPSRGKHNGSHKGIEYFKTKYPRSGSFVRAKKLGFGVPITDGIKERYGRAKEEDENFGICKETLILPQAPGSQVRTIEVVGLKDICETQSKYDVLKVVSLHNMLINGAGPPNVLSQFSPSIVELDLSRNLISSWDNLSEVTAQLPFLKYLNISDNRLVLPEEPEKLTQAFGSVRHLLLQRMSYNWEQILMCMRFTREVDNLMIAGNGITHLSVPKLPILGKLRELDIQFNNLLEWDEVLKLGELSNLECLNLSNNKLKSIHFKDAPPSKKTKLFPNLKVLMLSCNDLQNWKDLAELNKLNKLENLTIRKIPIVDSYRFEDVRMNLFPRIGGLKIHNHSEVTGVERKGAEYEYIRKYAKQWFASQNENDMETFCEEHPRYKYLISAYGTPDPNEVDKKPANLKSNVIKITIATPDIENSPSYDKKIPKTMTVRKLKALVQRLIKHSESDSLELSYKDNSQTTEISLDNDLRALSFYSVEADGIIVARWSRS